MCVSVSTVKTRSLAVPLKFPIRKLRCFFRVGERGEKDNRSENCSLPRYFAPAFRSRLLLVVSLNDEASLGLLRLLDLVQLFTAPPPPPYPSARPKRNSGSSVLSNSGRIFSERYCENRGRAFLVLPRVNPPLYDIPIGCLFSAQYTRP